MARRAEEIPNDPVLVLIEDGEPDLTTFDEWLATLASDEPTEIDADAAEILREIREHGERRPRSSSMPRRASNSPSKRRSAASCRSSFRSGR